jgi:uncharacterized protein (DUF1697 family)
MTTSQTIQYLALLRGINVGGNNIIKMTHLKECFENMGFTDVTTYIQSGNVIFKSADPHKDKLLSKIETELSGRFDYKSKIVLITQKQLHTVINNAPQDFGKDPDMYRYDVLFLKEPLSSDEAMKSIREREGVDKAYAGRDVIYFSRFISKAGQSYLNKLISLAIYKNMTIRNWNTTSKLFVLMSRQK